MHDSSGDTAKYLPQMLDYLIEKGYTFGTLDQLLESYVVRR